MSLPYTSILAGGLPLSGDGTIKPLAILDCADTVGNANQILSSTSTTLEWIDPPVVSAATPTALGTVYGFTTDANPVSGSGDVALGLNAYCSVTTGYSNTAIGGDALLFLTSGCNNIGIGDQAGQALTTECNNVVVGANSVINGGMSNSVVLGSSIDGNTAGDENILAGYSALNTGTSGTAVSCSVILGACALTSTSHTGSNLVGIGHKIAMPNSGASTQLAIGNCSSYWLSGDSNYAIKPGGGIKDVVNSCGSAGQFLTSSGFNSVQWASVQTYKNTSSTNTFGSIPGTTVNTLTNPFGPALNSWNYVGLINFTLKAVDTVTSSEYFYVYNGMMYANGSSPFTQTQLASTLQSTLGGRMNIVFGYDTAYQYKPMLTISFVSGNPLNTTFNLNWINLSGDFA